MLQIASHRNTAHEEFAQPDFAIRRLPKIVPIATELRFSCVCLSSEAWCHPSSERQLSFGRLQAGQRCEQRSTSHILVWLKIKQEGLRRCWSMFPLTRVPFWLRFFGPQPYGSELF